MEVLKTGEDLTAVSDDILRDLIDDVSKEGP